MNKNLFATALTYPAPSANYRGESEENRMVMQKVTDGRFEFPIISPEAMRNALREMLAGYGLPCNRKRLHNEEHHPYKRDSVLRMNLAKGLSPYRHDTILTQSPVNVDSPWKNATTSALLHRETAVIAFQYPFALNLNDVFESDGPDEETRKQWLSAMLRAIAEMSAVAGNHARSLFQMAPASIVIRLTERLVPGYDSYGFKVDDKGNVTLPEIVDGIRNGDYPGEEFYLGGTLIKQIGNDDKKGLEEKGVHLFRMADKALAAVSQKVTEIDFLQRPK